MALDEVLDVVLDVALDAVPDVVPDVVLGVVQGLGEVLVLDEALGCPSGVFHCEAKVFQ